MALVHEKLYRSLDINQAVPAGLIINEIVTNSIKYAFTNQSEGTIVVTIRQMENGVVLSRIGDNGVGIPKGGTFENPSSLGLQIISLLTRQLGGSISVNRKDGTEIEVRF